MTQSAAEATLELHLRAHDIPFTRERQLVDGRRWRVDFYIDERLVVEIEGWGHRTRKRFEEDIRKYNRLAADGHPVLRFTPKMVKSGEAIDFILERFSKR